MPASAGLTSEAARGDMAAKGYGYFRSKSGVSRRYQRPTMRPRLARLPPAGQNEGTEGPDSDAGYSTRKVRFQLTPSPAESTFCPTPALSTTYGDTIEDTDTSGPETPSPLSNNRSVSFDSTDFSAHVNKALDRSRSNASSLAVFEVGSDTRAAPEADLYGWEAELKRKSESGYLPLCGSSAVRSYLAHDQSHETGVKRNLLQRVFSLADGRRSGR